MSIKAMKQVIELYDKHCYNNDYGGIEFNKKHGYKFIEAIEALRTAIQQAEAKTDEPVAWLDEMLADTKEVFDANGTETPQVVRDVIEYVASWITVYNEKHRLAPVVPDNAACKSVQKRLGAQQPATTEPVGEPFCFASVNKHGDVTSTHKRRDSWRTIPLYTHPAPGVPEFSRIAKRKLDELQEQGFAITGYAIQRGPVRGFIDGGGFVGWWQGEPDPGAPDAAIDSAIYNQCPDFDDWHEGPSIDDIRAIVRAAMLAASPAQKGGV